MYNRRKSIVLGVINIKQIENRKIFYVVDKTLVLSITCDKSGSNKNTIFKKRKIY